MTPFDYEAACSGAHIRLRDGTPAEFLMDNIERRFVLVQINGMTVPYSYNGQCGATEAPDDLVMA